MKKKMVFVVMAFFAIACFSSCERDNPTPDTPDNPVTPSDFDTYEEIETYCIDNGWSECSLVVTNYNDMIDDKQNGFLLYYNTDGTLGAHISEINTWHGHYRLYSSFSKLISVDTVPSVDEYIKVFTCDDMKFGICSYTGYSKFFIKRVNDNTIKIFYKKCDLLPAN